MGTASIIGVDCENHPPVPSCAGNYRCIVIDPPWDQGKTGLRAVRPNQGQDLDYPTMTFGEIAAMDVGTWAADDSFLWLWATNSRSRSSGRPILQQAFDLMEHWGFRYYTILTWDKGTGPCPFGPFQITTEHCLFGYKGKFNPPKASIGQMKTLICRINEAAQREAGHTLRAHTAVFPRAQVGHICQKTTLRF